MATIKKAMPFLQQNTITREHLARAIRRYTALNINKASGVVDDLIMILSKSICARNAVKIRLFGTFATKKKNARVGRNPKTMIEANIPAREVVKFTVAPTLKKRINENIDSIL